jgi:methylisocitrate lyase
MAKAAFDVYKTLKNEGSQKSCLDKMQTRDELYEMLNYHTFEEKLDSLNKK